MEYEGVYIKPWFDGFTWDHGNYFLCPSGKELDCLHYKPADTIDWHCIHVNGDNCKWRKEEE